MGRPPVSAAPDDDGGFLSRWSRRKVQVRQGAVPAEPPAVAGLAAVDPALAVPSVPAAAPNALPPAPAPAPTLDDVAALTRDSDYARFVAPGVDSGVKNAALKKLFTDPHFNVMDGLDTYIDDYGQADPLPAGMLRQMAQSHALGLFSDEADDLADDLASDARQALSAAPAAPDLPDTAAAAGPESLPGPRAEPETVRDEDPDLRLQPHPAAGPPGAGAGPGPHAGREH